MEGIPCSVTLPANENTIKCGVMTQFLVATKIMQYVQPQSELRRQRASPYRTHCPWAHMEIHHYVQQQGRL